MMQTRTLVIIELVMFFGVAFAIGVYELWSLRRWKQREDQRALRGMRNGNNNLTQDEEKRSSDKLS